ncbi:arylesterase [Neiella marina]|uniref:Arylesterase n=1 Tax=Neiella holothuriorum TaxID=2870530 RepID=A0ABS7EF83_9GAMM|nr:arylesterase [Neiella holothuriorum]MBW8191012.1 arylesterase [Neiella holothuriorum]
MWKHLFFCFLFVVTAGHAQTVLIYGDSLSAGYGMEPEQAWPSLIAQRWQQDQPWTIVNASVSGETTQGGLARMPAALAAHQPSLVLLELGANDGLRGYQLSATKQNLQRMVELSQQQGAQVILAEMMIPPNYGPRYSKAFSQIYRDLATELNIELLPFFLETVAVEQTLMQADGLHPNVNAQPLIADLIEPWLHKHLLRQQIGASKLKKAP